MPSNISIYNLVNGLALDTTMSGGLESSAYSIKSDQAPPLETTNYLTFNRSSGVKKGKTYDFATNFLVGDIHFVAAISLTGTSLYSNFWIELSATASGSTKTTGQVSTVSSPSFTVAQPFADAETLNYDVTLARFLNGSFDDVLITIEPTTQS